MEAKPKEASIEGVSEELGPIYRALFEASHDVIVLADASVGIIDVNPRAAQITGYTLAQLRRMNMVRDVVVPEDAERLRQTLAEVRQGQNKRYEIRWKTKDGLIVEFDVITVPLALPGHRGMSTFCSLRDISRRKAVERELRDSEKRLQQILATLPVGVAVLDGRGDVTLTNAMSRRIWGGEVIVSGAERWARSTGLWHGSGKRLAESELASVRALREGRTTLNQLIDIETFDGRPTTIQNSAAPIRNEDGDIVGAVVVNEDVTERVGAENELRRALEAVRATSEKLQLLSRRLVELQENERRDIARELHDRVGQALTAMRINMDMIRKRLDERDDPLIRARNDDSLELLESMFNAVENVMYELRPPMLDEFGLIAPLQWFVRKFTERTGIDVEIRAEEGWRGRADTEVALFRIAQEALTNVARHATARRAVVEFRERGPAVVLTIEDDGTGFDEKADRVQNGYGLTAMRERAEAVGGTLEVRSEKGRGTRITAEMPAA